MNRDTVIFIAKLYIRQELRLTPTTFEVFRCPEDDVRSKFLEFQTQEGDTVEVCIRPQDGIISSTSRCADGKITTHSATYRKVPLEEVFGSPRKD